LNILLPHDACYAERGIATAKQVEVVCLSACHVYPEIDWVDR